MQTARESNANTMKAKKAPETRREKKNNKTKKQQISGVRDKKANKKEERIEKDVTLLNERREGEKLVPIVVKSCYIHRYLYKRKHKIANKKQYTINACE